MNLLSRSRKHSIIGSFVLLFLPAVVCSCVVAPGALAGGSGKPRTVVVLYPDGNDGRPGDVAADRGIRATVAGGPEPVEIYSEHLDVSRFPDPAYQERLAEFLRRKYAGRKIDVIIAGLTLSLDFALRYREQAFPGVPIVFCAVDQREVQARKLPPDVIGVPIKMDMAATLDVALRLHPNTERVFVITGTAKFDVEWEAEARRIFRAYEDKLEFVYVAGLPLPELLKQIGELPERSIGYYVHVFKDSDGKILIPADVLKRLAANANVPIYGHVDTYVGRGVVGGRVFSFEHEGKNAAALALRIIAGEKPEQIGVQSTSENSYMFDWRELRRWGISEASLPSGSIVRHYEPGFWILYRWHILGVIALCGVETLLIFGLLVQRASRRRAERRFQQAVEAAPNAMLMVGSDGIIVLANAQMEKLFGYSTEEILGRPAEMLFPERFRSQYAERLGKFFASPQPPSTGVGREVLGRRKDGTEVPIESWLSPVRTETGLCVLASLIDVTERKRAEMALHESESRFRLMADKAPVMIWMSGYDKLCTYFNKPWLDFTGRSLQQELGDGWSEGVHADDLQQCVDTYYRAFDARRTFRMEYRLKRFDGEYRWVLDIGIPRFDSDGTFEGYIGSCLDLTEQREVMEALRESQRESRELTGRVLLAQETERRRIARELHDDLNQSLSFLSVQLDILNQNPPKSLGELVGRMQKLSTQVKQLSSTVHDLSHQLHPAKLEQLGLVAAVHGLCKDLTQSHGVPVDFAHTDVPETVPEDMALCLYRIVQEALQNVIKHSSARRAAVELRGDTATLCLRVVDDGRGFDPGLVDDLDGGLGLVSMRERLRLVRGTITIDSRPAAGTRIEVRVPLSCTDLERINLQAQAVAVV